jgi:bla regulator protein blaR1
MGSLSLLTLVELIGAASVAILVVGALRIPLRYVAGAQAAYWLWLMVPASTIAALLPPPARLLGIPKAVEPGELSHAVTGAVVALTGTSAPMRYAALLAALWVAGAAIMIVLAAYRQRAFVRSLGSLTSLPDGTYRSTSVMEPMVVGMFRPRVILPADFEARYTREERALVLAHERAHVRRGDSLTSAIATGWLCLFWFNPLMYWAIGRLRLDQELACDALALATTGAARRRYADALLKAQLAADSFRAVPAGCHWIARHPLKERVAVLKRPLPSTARRASGIALALTLIIWDSYAVWADGPLPRPPPGSFSSVAINTVAAQKPTLSYGLLAAPARINTDGCGESTAANTTFAAPSAARISRLSDCAAEQPTALAAEPLVAKSAKATSHMCPKSRARANALLKQKTA